MSYFEKISKADNLLITIGDSWTEGVGCYDTDTLDDFHKKKIDQQELYLRSRKGGSFSKGSWPYQLSNFLNCDLINLGAGGDANSSSAKRLIQDYHEVVSKKIQDYKKINLIWLLTSPDRFGFYSDNTIVNFLSTSPHQIVKNYFTEVNKNDLDNYLETAFYLRSVYWYCKANRINFMYGSAFNTILPLNEIYNTEENFHNYISYDCVSKYLDDNNKRVWAHCGHPNSDGYYIIANKIFQIMNHNFEYML